MLVKRLLAASLLFLNINSAGAYDMVCMGSSGGLSRSGDAASRYRAYEYLYSNCTYVQGNLEIIYLDEADNYDLSFLSTIRQVSGYVLIAHVRTDFLPLSRLEVIRGYSLFQPSRGSSDYSLYISNNYKLGSTTVGIRELRLTSLHDILSGDVLIHNNSLLCYANTIEWADILAPDSEVVFRNSLNHTDVCGTCDDKCAVSRDGGESKHCWGTGPDMCQSLIKTMCSPQCYSSCFGNSSEQCCHRECLSGCTGPLRSQCSVCRNFEDANKCVGFCPAQELYDPTSQSIVPNPDAKLIYGRTCVDQCPDTLVAEEGVCTFFCRKGWIAYPDKKTCQRCNGPCPNICNGLKENEYLHRDNLGRFRNCDVVDGSIRILQNSFEQNIYGTLPIHPSNLSVFETLKEVSGSVLIHGEHEHFNSLQFLRNLMTIKGTWLDRTNGAALHVSLTSIKRLEMTSLAHVENGNIVIISNKNLCYASGIDWEYLFIGEDQRAVVTLNRDDSQCLEEGEICDEQCSEQGCWGAGDQHCLSCAWMSLGKRCAESCTSLPGFYQIDDHSCGRCHESCNNCTGPDISMCAVCDNFLDSTNCVLECPPSKYPDEVRKCQNCHANCKDGCTGPVNGIGVGACNSCTVVELDVHGNITQCLPPSTEICKDGFFRGSLQAFTAVTCQPCHPFCKSCNASGPHHCYECQLFIEDGKCVRNCSQGYREEGDICQPCPECRTGYFTCGDCTCIRDHLTCDGIIDCEDGSDEHTDICHPELISTPSKPFLAGYVTLGVVIPTVVVASIISIIVWDYRRRRKNQNMNTSAYDDGMSNVKCPSDLYEEIDLSDIYEEPFVECDVEAPFIEVRSQDDGYSQTKSGYYSELLLHNHGLKHEPCFDTGLPTIHNAVSDNNLKPENNRKSLCEQATPLLSNGDWRDVRICQETLEQTIQGNPDLEPYCHEDTERKTLISRDDSKRDTYLEPQCHEDTESNTVMSPDYSKRNTYLEPHCHEDIERKTLISRDDSKRDTYLEPQCHEDTESNTVMSPDYSKRNTYLEPHCHEDTERKTLISPDDSKRDTYVEPQCHEDTKINTVMSLEDSKRDTCLEPQSHKNTERTTIISSDNSKRNTYLEPQCHEDTERKLF